MGTVFLLIPLAAAHIILGLFLCIFQLLRNNWKGTIYFAFSTLVLIGVWQLYGKLKPTYRPLYKVLIAHSKQKQKAFVEYRHNVVLEGRKQLAAFRDPSHIALCSALEYPVDVEEISSALLKKISLEKPCPLLHGREALPLIALLQESFEPWLREKTADKDQQLDVITDGVDALLKAGADPNSQDVNGNTPLHFATKYRDERLVSKILEFNACVHLENQEKRSVLGLTRNSEIGKILQKAALDPKMIENCPQLRGKEKLVKQDEMGEVAEHQHVNRLFYGVTNGRIDIVTHLVQIGVDVNSRDNKGRSPLHLATACKEEMPAIIEILLRAEADIDARDRYGNTPLMEAVKNHCSDVVEILLEREADSSLTDRNGQSVLHLLARWKAEMIGPSIDILLKSGLSLETSDKLGRTPAMMTQYSPLTGDDALQVFLAKGADPNAADNQGNTLLHKLASDSSRSERTAGAIALIEAGADLEKQNKNGMTPLMVAVKKKKVEISRTLLAYGASPDVKTSRGTPLLHSVVSCDEKKNQLLELLLQAGADVNLVDSTGRTAMHRAFLNHLHLRCIEPIEQLLRRGADVNTRDKNEMAPLHNLAHWEEKDAQKALTIFLQYGGEIDITDSQGMTTLLRVARYGKNVLVTEALLTSGADPQAVDVKGNSLLHSVAMNQKEGSLKQFEVIFPLMEDLTAKNNAGKTPVDLALIYGNKDIAEKIMMLLEKDDYH